MEQIESREEACLPENRVQVNVTSGRGGTQSTPQQFAPYEIRNGCMWAVSLDSKGNKKNIILSHFLAEIIEHIILDDGEQEKHFVKIKATHRDGSVLGDPVIPISDLNATSWVIAKLGPRAIVSGNAFVAGLFREAIQYLSKNIIEKRVYTRTGWVTYGSDRYFTHSGGSIGPSGESDQLSVELEGSSALYRLLLPSSPEEERAAMETAMKLLLAAPLRLSVPSIAAAFRAPLFEADPVDFVLFVVGGTGLGKSAYLAGIQRFFGERFSDRNFPANWTSTANALQYLAAICKDCVLVIDDFLNEGACLATATRFLRNYRNGAVRGRLGSDLALRPDPKPKGLVITSGEDTPRGASIVASLFICQIFPGDIKFSVLSEVLEKSHPQTLPKVMGGYVRFIASRYDQISSGIKSMRQDLRDRIGMVSPHRRTTDMVAHLYIGWHYFLEYAESIGAISSDEKLVFAQEGWNALLETGKAQEEFLSVESPVDRGLGLLRAVLKGFHAHLRRSAPGKNHYPDSPTEFGWKPYGDSGFYNSGNCIGFVSDTEVWLEDELAYGELQKLARSQGRPFLVSQEAFWRALRDAGIILIEEEKKLSCKRQAAGSPRRRYKVIPLAAFREKEEEIGDANE